MKGNEYILLAGYARCGQGWLGYMLAYILNAKFVEPYCLLRGILYSADKYILNLTQGNLPGRNLTKYSTIAKTHSLPDPYISLTNKIIIVSRDPRDVAVSAYSRNIVMKRTGSDLTTKDKEAALINTIDRYQGILEKIRNNLLSVKFISYLFTAFKWNNYYNSWDKIELCLNISYEELSNNPKHTLKKILDYLEVEVEDKIVNQAINKFTFEALSGRIKGKEDESNTSFRKGIVGDYKNNINNLNSKIIMKLTQKPSFKRGYN
tara:strand:- start:701 stop:1489 length:789 start_codon:yes stop_codon:yes gene_type:complete